MQQITFYELRSFGFLHPGREDWKRFTKRCFDVIPGSTMYGAVANALIKMECDEYHKNEKSCVSDSSCAYSLLLNAVKEKNIRFSPLVWSKYPVNNLIDYNKAALSVLDPGAMKRSITPHTSVNRHTEAAQESQLFMNYTHPPFMNYYGFIVHNDGGKLLKKIKKAIRYFPCLPFGGDGKFCTTEVSIKDTTDRSDALKDLLSTSVRFLTPAIIDDKPDLISSNIIESSKLQFKLYNFWRRGFYIEGESPTDFNNRNYLTSPVLGVVDGSNLMFKKDTVNLTDMFIEGYCHNDWKYLGWGQVVFGEEV